MLFHSMAFAIFLPIVFILYWICPAKYRYIFLIAASFYFYMYMDKGYALFLLFASVVSFFLALALQAAKTSALKKICLFIGVLLLGGALMLLKCLDSFLKTAGPPSPAIQFMLPVGISFYTFQTLGYLIDIYREKYPAERHFGYYCLFVSFFPQLLSGPIGRGDVLLPQLRKARAFDSAKASYGMKLMAVGYFKKLVIAGLLAPTVDRVYGKPESYAGLVYIIATLMFALQIYCDFSGYTDIAIGCAALFGIDLPENFKSPYFSHSIKEFWNRWHISLSTWFRDYVYIPLGGNRMGSFRHCLNLLLTFLISGLWHGIGVNYLLWGGLHGVYRIIEVFMDKTLSSGKKIPPAHSKCGDAFRSFFSRIATFTAVCFAWIFFRSDTPDDAWRIITFSFHGIGSFPEYLKTAVVYLDMSYTYMIYLCLPIFLLAIYDYASLKTDVVAYISARNVWVRYSVYILFLLVILLFSEKGVSTDFYYFQF